MKVTFETATLQAAIKSASRVAPSKGAAYDQASGIVLELDPSSKYVTVKSTDTETYFMEWVDYMSMEGDPDVWRVSSKLLSGVVATLPIGSGKTTTLERTGGKLILSSARTRAHFPLGAVEYYPAWNQFDSDVDLTSAFDLGARIDLVAWAAHNSEVPINGVHLDGEYAVATDRYKVCRVPLKIDMPAPVTIPADSVLSLIKQTGEVKIGFTDHQMLFSPESHVQIQSVIYGLEYLKLDRIAVPVTASQIKVRKDELMEKLTRAANFTGADRFPRLELILGNEEFAVLMKADEVGLLGDVIEVPGQATHTRLNIGFTADNIVQAIAHAPGEEVTFGYSPDKPNGPVYIEGGSGYECWVAPRKESTGA